MFLVYFLYFYLHEYLINLLNYTKQINDFSGQ